MTLVLAVLCLALIADKILTSVNSRRERDTLLKAVELAIREGNKEREIHAQNVKDLSNRIVAPEAAPFIQNGQVPKQYLGEAGESEAESGGWD